MNKQTSSTLDYIISQGVKLTPMMQQYHEIKKNYPGTLLLFRMGDFYELFFEDAKQASKLLNITLTHRGKLGEFPIPMAGIPFHAANNYVDKITQLGLKAAICEQVEDPKATKGIVKRAVTQVASPAMPYDLEKISGVEYNFLASASFDEKYFYLTLIDYTTGHFLGHQTDNFETFLEKLQLYSPREFISYFDQWEKYPQVKNYIDHYGITHTNVSQEYFESKFTQHLSQKLVPNFQHDKTLQDSPDFLKTIGALSFYITSTQALQNYQHIQSFQLIADQSEMKVTYSTLSGLEILPRSRDRYRQSLLGYMDKTRCALGARKLKRFFLSPSRDYKLIKSRQAFVSNLMGSIERLESIRESLESVRDIERIMAKTSTGKANAGDLVNLARSSSIALNLYAQTQKDFQNLFPSMNKSNQSSLKKLIDDLERTLNDEVGAALDKGNLIKDGFHPQRDKLASIARNSHQSLKNLEARYREEFQIPNLRVKSNNVAGYFVEVSKSHTHKIPSHLIRRQTLVNSERYMSEELNELEKEVFSAKDKLHHLEREIFKKLLEHIKECAKPIQEAAEIIALNDVYQSMAWIALQKNFVCPDISKKLNDFEVSQAFHPLIKHELGEHFVTHSLTLNKDSSFALVTGPNMAGKTTVMREMAIIQFLAQVGSFVPAASARVSLCDYLFSRLGASDDILKGQSTFMVEMSETAEILRHATSKSFIILDEIGRGTSTYDGLSIAWALVEYITSKVKCLSLFSTHYHELIKVADDIKNAKNLTVKTKKQGDKVVFLYELIEQGATQSFGINVASLAGIPKSILTRANDILQELETQKQDFQQISLFGIEKNIEKNSVDKLPHWLEQEVSDLDINSLSPLEALNLLSQWKSKC